MQQTPTEDPSHLKVTNWSTDEKIFTVATTGKKDVVTKHMHTTDVQSVTDGISQRVKSG